jgi:tetratricopeptide (TPR) repeat protein
MRSLLISAASAFGLLLLACALSSAPAAAQASCTVTYDCQGSSGCSSVMGGNVTTRTLSYASQSACDSAAAQAQHGLPTIRCNCGGGGTTNSDLSGQMGQLISTMTPQQQMGMAVGAVGTVMILKGLSELMSGPAPDPAAQQRALAAQQLNNSGIYLMKQKNYSGAINEFQQALAQTPNNANIANNLAMAKQAQQNSALAQQRSGELGQLLGTTPAGAGNPEIASNNSPLNLVNLNNANNPNSGAGDLRPPGETPPVDPVSANQSSVQGQIDSALGTQPAAPAPAPTQAGDIDQIFNPSQSAPQASPPQAAPQQTQIDAEQKQVDDLFAAPAAAPGSTPASAQLAQQASLGQAAANAPSPEAASAMAGQGFDTAAPGTVTPQTGTPQTAAAPSSSGIVDLTHSQQAVGEADQPLVTADLKTPPAPANTAPGARAPGITVMRAPASDTFSAPGSPIFDCAGDRMLIQRLASGLPAQDDAIRRTEDAMKAAKEDSDTARTKAEFAAVSTLIASASTAANWAQMGMAKASASSMELEDKKEMLDTMDHVVELGKKLNELTDKDEAEIGHGAEAHGFSNATEVESTAKMLDQALEAAKKLYLAGKFDDGLEKVAAVGASAVAGPVGGATAAAAIHTLVSALDLYVNTQQAWNSAGEAEAAEHDLEGMRYEELQVRSRIYDLQQEIAVGCSNTKTAGD